MSSWQEYKKIKKRDAEDVQTSSNLNTEVNKGNMGSWQKFKLDKENNSGTNISSWQKFKQEKETSSTQTSSWQKFKEEKTGNKSTENEEEQESTWFKKSELYNDDEGNIVTDTLGTIGATAGDVGVNLIKGAGGLVEGVGDLISYGAADVNELLGNKDKANELRTNAQVNTVDEFFKPAEDYLDKYSVLGEKSDSIVEGLGYVAAITAVSIASGGIGGALGASSATAATIGSTAATFTSAMGNGMTEALNDGATIDEARIYGAISGAAEAGSELMFGGLGKASQAMGLSRGALDDVVVGGLTKNIKNKMVKTVVQSGLKAGGEGLEEVVSGFISALGKKATYMNDKELKEIIKDENLAEQFWMGALTSAIAQTPSTIRSVTSGTDYITGRTNNEQKVYDNEVKERTESKARQATIEQSYNEQIKAQENLGIEITEDLKSKIMKKVENAYDNGTLKSTELSKKDRIEIEEQVEKDLEEGNISTENIMKTLGENQDISKDNLLMKSMYENEQKYNSYKVEQTDNEKVNVLMQSAADAGMNNTSKTRKKVELISKLVQDTDRQYKFVSSEQLKEMGYNENANGLINKSTGEILINAHSDKGIQSIVGHETTHIFDSKDSKGVYSKEYQTLQEAAIEYARTKGIYDSKVQSITDAYGDLLLDETQIKEELTADLVGDFLFNDEQFIENLAVKNRNVFQKIYDYIKHIYKVATAGTEEAKALENLKYQFDKVYKTISAESNTDTKYSIAGKEGMKNAIKNDTEYLKIERNYNKAQQMQKNGTDNETIRQNTGWFQDKNGDWKFEFSDKDMTLKNVKLNKNGKYKLQDILKHDTLFTAYPQLKELEIQFKDLDKANGNYNQKNNNISINNKLIGNNAKISGTIIHEIQHAIQSIEGFEKGTNSIFKENYYKSLGEIEAKDTQIRYIQEKKGKLDRNLVAPESSKSNPQHIDYNKYIKNRNLLDKIKDSVYNYLKNKNTKGGDNYEVYQENMEQFDEEDSENIFQNDREIRRKTWDRRLENNQNVIEESENNSGSFSFDKNAKRYEDLSLSNTINYNKHSNEMLNIEMFNDNELINQITVDSKEEAIKQLGNNIGSYIYENANEKSQTLNLEQQERVKQEPTTHKEKQLDIINNTNPMLDDYHVGIRNIEDIKTFEEVVNNDDESFAWGDFSKEDAEKALKKGKVTIYSSYPIEQGVFVSTSKIQAEEYAGGKGSKVYSKTVPLDEVAWINGDEGQYANTKQKYSLTNDTQITGDDISAKDMLKQEKNTIEDEVGNTKIDVNGTEATTKVPTVEEVITQTEEQKQQEIKDGNIDKKLNENKGKITRKKVRQQLLKEMNIKEEELANGNDISSLNFQVTDPVRVNEKVFGREIGKKINDVTINKTKHNTAEKIRWQNREREDIKNLGIKARSKESAAVQKYGEKQYVDEYGKTHEYGDKELAIEFKDEKTQNKIKNAAKVIREKYDTYIDQMNNTLTALGYDAIPKRENYMRHFQELTDKFSQAGIPLNLNDMKAEDLPTDINGLTEFNKPGRAWFASAMERTGEKTNYDAITGIDGYLEGAGNYIFHTEDIQNYRALSTMIRETYGRMHGLDNIENMTEEQIIKRFEDIKGNKLSKYVAWLDEQANSLAGKKGAIDRGVERMLGRRTYTIMNTAKKQVGSNMTGFNVRSALTNLISSVIASSKTNKVAFMQGTISTINNMIHKDDFIDKSDFLTARFGSDALSSKIWQKISNAGQIFMTATDYFTSNQIVRSKYYEGLYKGMSEDVAIKYADDFAARVMGDRAQGSTAEIFNSKTLGLLTQFQLEVNNQWQFMIHDTKMDFQQNSQENSGLKAGATIIWQMGQMAAYSYMFNELFEKLTGSRAAFDPIEIFKTLFGLDDDDEEKSWEERIIEANKQLVDNLPFASIFTGGRIPVEEAFTGISTFGKKITGQEDSYGNEISWKDVGSDMLDSAAYWVLPTGYSQLKKTTGGLEMYTNKVAGSYTDSGNLRYTVDDDVGSKAQAAVFGAYANPYAQDYIDSGYKAISKDNIEEMVGLDMNSTEYRQYKKGLSDVSKTTDKNGYSQYTDKFNNIYWYDEDTETMYDSSYNKTSFTKDDLTKTNKTEESLNYINSLDLTDKQKNIAANNLNKNSKKTIDMSEYGNYSSYDEYKYARDYPEKYSVVSQITDYDSFMKYKNDISDIKEKYSTEAGYESKERKIAIQSYINNLDLNMYQKMMLEKVAGGYSIKNYQNYIQEYLETTDLSNSEKYTIWEELFN